MANKSENKKEKQKDRLTALRQLRYEALQKERKGQGMSMLRFRLKKGRPFGKLSGS